jgi:hypothetical protein
VLDVAEARVAIIACLDRPEVLDCLPDLGTAFRARVSPGELWLVGPATAAADLLAHAVAHLARAASAGLAIDVTDAWSVCTVVGDEVTRVWARLSENRLPDDRPAFVQGAVASIPAKAIVGDDQIHVLTPSNLGHHVPHRILQACHDLTPHDSPPRQFAVRDAAPPTRPAAMGTPAAGAGVVA